MTLTARTAHQLPSGISLKRVFERYPTVDLLLGVGVFAVALGVYNATLAPSLSYRSMDGSELATVPYKLGLVHAPGYPLYTWLGKLFTFVPVGDVAHRVNLMSAVGAAGAAAFVYGIVRLLTTSRVVALFGALFLAFSGILWSQAVIAEVYAPNAFMVGLSLLLLVAWGRREEQRHAPAGSDRVSLLLFSGFALSYGLSLGTHLSNLALAPGIAVFVVTVNPRILRQRATMACAAVLVMLGALQYLWLPLKASTLNDPVMLENSPSTLEGFLNYTLNAFSEARFAVPLQAIPDRIHLYLEFVWDDFGPLGIGLGVVGMWAMFLRCTKVFYLLILVYLAEVGYFLQYRTLDIDVFFIPPHFIGALFAAYGSYWLLQHAATVFSGAGLKPTYALGVSAALLAAMVIWQVRMNWAANDLSDDTSVNDFYEQVFETLESGSVLIGQRGVSGYDMFYFRDVYDRRPDVLMPLLENPNPGVPLPEGATIYTVGEPLRGAARTPWDPPLALLPEESWYVPVLAAPTAIPGRLFGPQILPARPLLLYRLQQMPPNLFVDEASPEHPLLYDFGGIRFLGFDLSQQRVERGGSVHLTLYWQLRQPGKYVVSTRLGEGLFREVHWLGFGNLEDRLGQVEPTPAEILVEEYDLVVLSSTPAGSQTLSVQAVRIDPLTGWMESWAPADLAEILVLN
jgi:hypothetical protein